MKKEKWIAAINRLKNVVNILEKEEILKTKNLKRRTIKKAHEYFVEEIRL